MVTVAQWGIGAVTSHTLLSSESVTEWRAGSEDVTRARKVAEQHDEHGGDPGPDPGLLEHPPPPRHHHTQCHRVPHASQERRLMSQRPNRLPIIISYRLE